jgi:asparagine synthetase A
MKELIELNQWDSNGVLKYDYVSTDMEYLEDKADRIYKVIKAINKVEDRYKISMEYTGTDDSPEVTLHIQIELNEQYKCKTNKDI